LARRGAWPEQPDADDLAGQQGAGRDAGQQHLDDPAGLSSSTPFSTIAPKTVMQKNSTGVMSMTAVSSPGLRPATAPSSALVTGTGASSAAMAAALMLAAAARSRTVASWMAPGGGVRPQGRAARAQQAKRAQHQHRAGRERDNPPAVHPVRRRNPQVMIAPCGGTGRLRAEPVPALAELLPAAELGRVRQLMARKYRIDLIFIKPIRSLQAALRRGQLPADEVAVAITPVRA
jgi:hypothetical protein